jgi:bacterioferritin-associated ferredoxin
MYICLCRAITDKQLKDAYSSRNGNIQDTLKCLGVGSDCGTCLHDALKELEASSNAPCLEHSQNPNTK